MCALIAATCFYADSAPATMCSWVSECVCACACACMTCDARYRENGISPLANNAYQIFYFFLSTEYVHPAASGWIHLIVCILSNKPITFPTVSLLFVRNWIFLLFCSSSIECRMCVWYISAAHTSWSCTSERTAREDGWPSDAVPVHLSRAAAHKRYHHHINYIAVLLFEENTTENVQSDRALKFHPIVFKRVHAAHRNQPRSDEKQNENNNNTHETKNEKSS